MATITTKPGQKALAAQSSSQKWVMSTLALALSSAMMAPAFAEEVNLDTVVIEDNKAAADSNPYAEPDAPYKANRLSDSKRTRDIADTPQTMTVLTKESIADSGRTDFKDLLSAQPGITLGTGEGGNSFGDRYIIRGYEARSDVFTDGLREPGLITRETFALEQVEITKGPSSTFAGRGSTGGAVNSVTKKASLDDDFLTLSGGLGTDEYQRYTLDGNKVINEDFAIRFNALYADAEIPDRGPAEERRKGALFSAVYEPSHAFRMTADYYHFRADDRSDPGVAVDRDTNQILKYDYVGQDSLDFQEGKADIFTAGFDVELTEGVRLENKSRVGKTENDYIISAYASFAGGTRPFSGWQENDYLGNQTNLIFDKDIWGKRHTIVAGIELAKESMDSGNYEISPDSAGANFFGGVAVDPYNPDHSAWTGSTSRNAATTELELETVSAYLMDTLTLNEDWEVFAGVRYDHFDYDLWTAASNGRFGFTPEMDRSYSDGFWNGHAGVVFSPWENGNVYASWSTSSNINGGEADAGGSCGYGGLCSDADGNYKSAEPEQSTNLEIGTKWNLFDNNLLLTAAVFQTTKDDVIEGGNDSYSGSGSLNTGENRVQGFELGLSGNITDKLSGQMGFAMMHSETLKAFDPEDEGKPKANFAKRSFNGLLKYQATPKFAFGGAVTYSSGMFGGQPDAAANTDISIPGYIVYDAFASYQINDNMTVRANILNLFDKDYYTALYRGGSIVYKGDARSANVNLTYTF